MKFILEINMDNAAFDTADTANGNKVGTWEVTDGK